ncbi:hypothetical protein PLESTM_000072500 [Pleodorina starrii]|nr:hypothetical protein PLESTM_000072500 [Pleodorina starrii]
MIRVAGGAGRMLDAGCDGACVDVTHRWPRGWLLQAAMLNGQLLLVLLLLPGRPASCELRIIRRLRCSWLTYLRNRPPQTRRTHWSLGPEDHRLAGWAVGCSCAVGGVRVLVLSEMGIRTLKCVRYGQRGLSSHLGRRWTGDAG